MTTQHLCRAALSAVVLLTPALSAQEPAGGTPVRDARVGLRAGWWDAGQAAWNMRLVSTSRPPAEFIPTEPGDFDYMNSDVAFKGNYLIQGNFQGFSVWDITDPFHPRLVHAERCPEQQNDVSVYRNLLFLSGESQNGRVDCGTQGVQEPVSPQRFRGVRVIDICVAHNGNLIPLPGRDIMIQGWYQGGVSLFDFTDPAHATEIAYFDRGPMDSTKMEMAGSWSAYWYNGYIYSTEISRGLDVLELLPSSQLTQNEIDAAKLVKLAYQNVQDQQRLTWPATFVVAGAYLDQLERSHGLAADHISTARAALASAELGRGGRRATLTTLATQLDHDARSASDAAKVRTLAAVVRGIR